MDPIDIYNEETQCIIDLIEERRLKEALIQIQAMAATTQNWKLRSEIEDLQTSYNLMLDYNRKGIKDPNLKEIYAHIIRKVLELMDWARIEKESLQQFNEQYYITRSKYKNDSLPFISEAKQVLESYSEDIATTPLLYIQEEQQKKQLNAIQQKHEVFIAELFERIWTSSFWSKEDEQKIIDILDSVLVTINDLCIIISAVTMATLKFFDIRKFMFLLKAYQHTNPMVNQRALVGICIISLLYDWRIVLYPQAMLALEELKQNEKFLKNLQTIQMQLLLTRETEKIDRRMQEEIIPKMMRNVGERGSHIGFDELKDEDAFNPEWEKKIEESGLEEDIRAMGELQLAGADVYMSSFAQFKYFAFFKKMAHWFYPFDRQYPDLEKLNMSNNEERFSLINLLLNSDLFCNSDKYSFCFNLINAPESVQQMMIQQLKQNEEALSEQQQEQLKENIGTHMNAAQISRQYIHDLYRFFKLWRYRKEEYDVFLSGCQLWLCENLEKIIDRPKDLKAIADYLLQNGYEDEASFLYHQLLKSDKENVELYQKSGYALERQKEYQRAIEEYRKAELFQPSNQWTLKHLALCLMRIEHYHEAYEYYKKLEVLLPDDLKLTMDIGRCLTMMQHYEEALPYFFKVEYLTNRPNEARRAIGWCSFVIGKYQQAQKYYEILLQEPKPKLQDWMNAGHVYLVIDRIEQAILCYKEAAKLSENHDEFIEYYQDDKPYLLAQGLSEEKIDLLPDELL